MEFLRGLYCKKVQYLQNIDDRQPVHGMGDMETYRLIRGFLTISTMMLITVPEEKITADQVSEGKVIPLLEAIDQRPKSLEKAMLSWVQFPGEDKPSAVFVHNGDLKDLFQNWVYTLIVSEIPLAKLGVASTYEEARKKAEDASLSEPINVKTGLEYARNAK